MKPEQFAELQKTILTKIDTTVDKSIEKYVNGKIRNLSEKVDDYIKNDLEHREIYKAETLEWREKIDKKVEPLDNLIGWSKTSLYFLGFLASVGGVVLIILKLLHGNK